MNKKIILLILLMMVSVKAKELLSNKIKTAIPVSISSPNGP